MTQIKLRRDTAANFTSKNPVLGIGEPAYETDTKKLKIGDGTTAYTQLEYFSTGGGGGSTNISASLPLKIVDGVISLEVDGQTIQIVDGKLHANLDELGNEVNTLAGRVTAAEADLANKASKADLDKKENKITAIAPITLKEEVKSNLKGMVYTTDSTGIYNPNGKGFSDEQNFDSQSDGIRIYSQKSEEFFVKTSDISPLGGILLPSYISIPYKFNQIVQTPNTDIFSYGYYCKTLADGSVVPIASVNSEIRSIGVSDTCFLTDYNRIICIGTHSQVSASETNVGESSWTHGSYAQLKDDGNTITQYYKSYPNIIYKRTISDTAVINRLKEIDCVVFTPMVSSNDSRIKFGIDVSTAFPVNQIGLYEGNLGDMLTAETEPAVSATNLFNLGGASSKNYLELNIGSGLTVTDGKLTSTGSSAPENMVTTDTAQTITGQKTFKSELKTYNPFVFDCREGNARFDAVYLEKGSGAITTSSIINLDLDKFTKDIILGIDNASLLLRGDVKNNNNKKFLTQGNITGTDNITVTETANGIQVTCDAPTKTQFTTLQNTVATKAGTAQVWTLSTVGTLDNQISMSWGASGSKYLAPANGRFLLEVPLSDSNQYIRLYCNKNNINRVATGNASQVAVLDISVDAGDEVVLFHNTSVQPTNFVFLKANGG